MITTSKKEKGLRYKKMLGFALRRVYEFDGPAKSSFVCYLYCEWKGIKFAYVNTLSVREMNKRAGNIVAAMAEVM